MEWSAYRAGLNCAVAKDVLSGKTPVPAGATRTEYSLYCLASAIEELAKLISIK